ncbi:MULTISPECIES: recombinase family protein [Sphingomonas]|uniref:recombinase family protein n=1 Tax=Sphingomonas TaxID=13687 RepID=UPI000F7F535E|nr:recombinase family protein [Sphingomonas sp. ABOLF]RSV14612.1 recombinase family protein [Sphingomonas sp. ABOLF]GLK19210.1 site-specific recombinase [Microbacterium terregens]
MKAIVYARWSSLEQAKEGRTTLARQLSLCGSFAERNGYTVVERITDEGRSAWTGDNIRTGNLGKLKERLERNGGHDLTIIVEKLDRLSRQSPLVVMNFLQSLCATGATIVSADGRHKITGDDLHRNMMGVLSVVFETFRGFDESQAKSERVGEAWRIKRERGGAMTKICPAWLRLKADRSGYELIPDRAAVVRRIFADIDAGVGKFTIANSLNAEGVEPWGTGKKKGNGWHASYIHKIITNMACVGDYQPHRKAKADVRRTPDGEIIRGYFPAVIDEATFARVNDRRTVRLMAQQRPGRSLVNLFGGLGKCSCGAIMTMRSRGVSVRADGTKVREDYLYCDSAIRKRGCENRAGWNYEAIERGVLDKLLHLALDPSHFRKADVVAPLEAELATLKRRLADDEKRMAKAYALALEDDEDDNAQAGYRRIKQTVKDAKAAISALEERLAAASGAVSPEQHLKRVDEVRALMNSDDPDERYQARAKVKLALNDLVAKMTFGLKDRVSVLLVDQARLFSIKRDGSIGEDLDLRAMFPGELVNGRFGPSTTRFEGGTTVNNELSPEQEAGLAGYLRRQRAA